MIDNIKFMCYNFSMENKQELIIKEKIDAGEIENRNAAKEEALYISQILSVDSIINNLVCDDTIWALFMQYRSEVPEINELITRNEQKKAVWKSFAEFQALFDNMEAIPALGAFSTEQMQRFFNREDSDPIYQRDLAEFQVYLNQFDSMIKFELVINKTKLAKIEHNAILIHLNEQLYGFDVIFKDLHKNSNIPPFFYLYCDKKSKEKLNQNDKKNDLIRYIKEYDRFRQEPSDKR